MSAAVCARRLQFEGGPQRQMFCACETHRRDLERGDVTCFYAIKSEPMMALGVDEDIECDLCREPRG